ncbi:MAG: hypothetical protein ACM3UZ_13305 [Acidobacteriota bacterium]
MARIEIDLPENVLDRLQGESSYSGEPAGSIIARALIMYFSQPAWEEPDFPDINFLKHLD